MAFQDWSKIPPEELIKLVNECCFDIPNRTLYLTKEMTEDEVPSIVRQLKILNSINHEPITLVINCIGGDDDAVFFLYDSLMLSESPIITVGSGMVCSAAALILACGDKRQATENAWLMVHQAEVKISGGEDAVVAGAKVQSIMSDRYWKLLARHTHGKSATDWYMKARDLGEFWLDVEGMLKWRVIDEIIKSSRNLPDLPKRKIRRLIEEMNAENEDDAD